MQNDGNSYDDAEKRSQAIFIWSATSQERTAVSERKIETEREGETEQS